MPHRVSAGVSAVGGGGWAGTWGQDAGGDGGVIQVGKILCDMPCLSRDEAYACLGLSELPHSDQFLPAMRHQGSRIQYQPLLTRECEKEKWASPDPLLMDDKMIGMKRLVSLDLSL